MERVELAALVEATGCSEKHGGCVFLTDPHWTPAQRKIYESLVANDNGHCERGWLCIPTGGSSGGLKFARHDEVTLTAAARGFADHFKFEQINTVDVLPPWHVSGLMARVRSFCTGGRHIAWPWKDLEQGRYPDADPGKMWTLSLVPTQLQRLLNHAETVDWLRRLALVLVGGGPVWTELADTARKAQLPVALSYGMTETAAMVCSQLPEDFAAGDDSSGRVMPHAVIEIDPVAGVIQVAGSSLMRGYFGDDAVCTKFLTSDRGYLDQAGRLHVQGRRDDIVITGGEKVDLREVEETLRRLPGFDDVAVLAMPDAEWGEVIVACYTGPVDPTASEQLINHHLARHQRPKHWLAFTQADWPRNSQGKVNRAVLRENASTLIHPGR